MSSHLRSLLSLLTTPSITDSVRESLASASECWFVGVVISGFMVAIGCLLEVGETKFILTNWRNARKGLEVQEEDPASWHKPVAAIGLVLVVLGIVSETICERYVSVNETAIRAHDEGLLGVAELHAAEANASAEALKTANLTLQGQVAGLQTDASDAQKAQKGVETKLAREQARAAKAETETLRLREAIQPRQYTASEENAIVRALMPFAASTVAVRSLPYDVEGALFATYLSALLRNRTKLLIDSSGVGNPFLQNLPMLVDVHIVGPKDEQPLMAALASALSTPRVIAVENDDAFPRVTIIVGAKRIVSAKLK